MRKSLKGRFFVWDLGTDRYNNSDLVLNWDKIDEIVGGADGDTGQSSSTAYPTGKDSTWLGSTSTLPATPHYPGNDYGSVSQQVGARTLYSIAAGLNYNDVPLGTVVAWWRPVADPSNNNPALKVPSGWVICDGRTIPASQHSFGTNTPITLPDLINKTVVGSTTTQGASATTSYVNEPTQAAKPLDGASYGPGLGYDSGKETGAAKSGTNAIRDISHNHGSGSLLIPNHRHVISAHYHNVGSHTHSLAPHVHDMWHQHIMPNHTHGGSRIDRIDMSYPTGYDNLISNGGTSIRVARIKDDAAARNDDWRVPSAAHRHDIRATDNTGGRRYSPSEPLNYWQGTNLYPYVNYSSTAAASFAVEEHVGGLAFTSLPLFLSDSGSSNSTSRSDRMVANVNKTQRLLFTGQPYDVTNLGWGRQFYVDGEVANTKFDRTLGSTPFYTDRASGNQISQTEAFTEVNLTDANSNVANQVSGNTANWGPTGPATAASPTWGAAGSAGGTVPISQINPRTDYVGLLYIMKVKVSTNII
jgi:hypothetical protein